MEHHHQQQQRAQAPPAAAAAGDDAGAAAAPAPAALGLPPRQAEGLAHFKEAIQEVSATPSGPAEGGVGTELQGRDLFVAPSADGRRFDIVERIDLPGPEAISTDLGGGYGAHEGPVTPVGDELPATGAGLPHT
ncbi:hypothetical protein Rsub_06949 [Raphidocelis subcapitata]|uniref:Uncharacterized protein n=1 Tax=Raphidocelis subcapitata TaxID=307507 RepID=A0A2V0PAX6_9CHLO|nr:hypothetical protein Rsub_06949 [Raphidocelis subcapitata]|eukprot:GBF94327.1 hypothetical protein Rsub_06949 [Raphidocelis subcapitata]